MKNEHMSQRLQLARKKAGYSNLKDAAAAFGWSVHTYKSHEAGERGFLKHVPTYASAFKVREEWLQKGEGPMRRLASNAITMLTVSKSVSAGVWRAVEEPEEPDFTPYEVAYVGPHKYANYFAVRVEGDSMEIPYPPGTTLICVPLIDFGKDLVPGMKVIVNRIDGGVVECTCKQLAIDPAGNKWLQPMTNNPSHEKIRLDQEEEGVIIEIIGVVVSKQELEDYA